MIAIIIPLTVAVILNLRDHQLWYQLLFPLLMIFYLILELLLDYILKFPFRTTPFRWKYIDIYYIAS
jgi:hypothetical protein